MCKPTILDIIVEEDRKNGHDADSLRCAAWYVKDEYPDATSKQFADACVNSLLGITRKSAINRWNEAMNNLEKANA